MGRWTCSCALGQHYYVSGCNSEGWDCLFGQMTVVNESVFLPNLCDFTEIGNYFWKKRNFKTLHLGWEVSFECFSTFTISFFVFKTAVEKKLKHFGIRCDCKIL